MKMRVAEASNKYVLQNGSAVLEFDTHGGIIESFRLADGRDGAGFVAGINPLDFHMDGYRGHFLCAGRWGDPSASEAARGCVKHGDLRLLPWNVLKAKDGCMEMDCQSPTEQLHVHRRLKLHPRDAQFTVTETITNTSSSAMLCNLVQHPTVGGAFMTADTMVACNATRGFHYEAGPALEMAWPLVTNPFYRDFTVSHPTGGTRRVKVQDLRLSLPGSGVVYSFIVDPAQEYGWVTAWSPMHRLLIGYVWKREDFPWINLWQHEVGGRIIYRGLEFGTTGLHASTEDITKSGNTKVFGTETVLSLPANGSRSFTYTAFLRNIPEGFMGFRKIGELVNKIIGESISQ